MDASHPFVLDTRPRPIRATMREPDGSVVTGAWNPAPCPYCGSTEPQEWILTNLTTMRFCSEQCAQWYIDEHVDEKFAEA